MSETQNTLTWRVGDVTITRIFETEAVLPCGMLFPNSDPAELEQIDWLRPHYIQEPDGLRISIQALVVQTPSTTLIVDTCAGNDKQRIAPVFHQLQTSFLRDLAQAGHPRERIDTVLCTHLHVDHVGWNTMREGDRWVPTFPNARYLLGREEVEHWRRRHGTDDAEPTDEQHSFADSVQPLFDLGLVDLVETDHRLCDEVQLVPTPGHTPGHVSVRITSRGEEALITGDFVHHPAQMARPGWACFIDDDPVQGESSRRRQFADLADRPVLVIGTHFASPTAGRISRDGETFRFDGQPPPAVRS